MNGAEAFLELPLGTLVALGAGYLSYRAAYVGKAGHHTQTDVIFVVIVFAAIAMGTSSIFSSPVAPDAGVFLGAWVAYVAALLWRKHISHRVAEAVRVSGYGDHDGQPTAWRTMLADQLKGPTRLVVYLKDGRRLMTSRLADFEHLKTGCCILGEDGSIAMYVTDTLDPITNDWIQQEPYDPENAEWGYELTQIPASEIARVEISRPN